MRTSPEPVCTAIVPLAAASLLDPSSTLGETRRGSSE
jgi:hypothetical protein